MKDPGATARLHDLEALHKQRALTASEWREVASLSLQMGRVEQARQASRRAEAAAVTEPSLPEDTPSPARPSPTSTSKGTTSAKRLILIAGVTVAFCVISAALALATAERHGVRSATRALEQEAREREPIVLGSGPLGQALAARRSQLEQVAKQAGGWLEMGVNPESGKTGLIEINVDPDRARSTASQVERETDAILVGLPEDTRLTVAIEGPPGTVIKQWTYLYKGGEWHKF